MIPTYDYICPECDFCAEIFHSMSDMTARPCPECNENMEKQLGCGYFIIDSGKPSLEKQIREREDRAKEHRNRAISASGPGPGSGKGKALGGQHYEVDKTDMIKALAKDPLAVKVAQDALKGRKKNAAKS